MRNVKIILLAMVSAISAIACTTTNSASSAPHQALRCDIAKQSGDLNRLLHNATDASLTSNAAQIEAIASDAGGDEHGQLDTAHEVACRDISLRAYGALLRVNGRTETALAGLTAQSSDGDLACNAIIHQDHGTQMDCADIKMWRQTIDAVAAVYALRGLDAQGNATQGASDATWSAIVQQAEIVQNSVANNWSSVPGAAPHKTRLACGFYGVMVDVRGWPSAEGNVSRTRLFAEIYPATMLAAVNALAIPAPHVAACQDAASSACDAERVDVLARRCLVLSGS